MTDAERMACIEAWSSGSWGDRLGEIVRICIAVEQAPTTPLTDEEIKRIWCDCQAVDNTSFSLTIEFARAVLAAQQEKK